MRPYKRAYKPIRQSNNPRVRKWLGRAGKATGCLWKDIQTIWFREPPFPASVRIFMSLSLTWALIMPFLYFLVPPLLTAVTVYFLVYEEFPVLPSLPPVPLQEQKLIVQVLKDTFKKATFRASMLVTLSDYVQTFRALGGFNGLNIRY